MFQRMPKISRSDFWVLSHDRLSDFYTSAWQRGGSPVPMLVVRLLLAGVAVGFLAWSLSSGNSGPSPLWLIYLTNWGLVLVTIMPLSGLLVSTMATSKKLSADADADTPWYVGLYWVIFTVTQNIAIVITILYWTLLYNPNTMIYPTTAALWLDIATHGFNSVISLSELLTSRTPIRWLHIYQPLLLGAVYISFSGIYFAADGTNALGDPYIYPVLNWNEPDTAAVSAFGSLAGLIGVHTLLWGLARGRNKLSDALRRTDSHDLPQMPEPYGKA